MRRPSPADRVEGYPQGAPRPIPIADLRLGCRGLGPLVQPPVSKLLQAAYGGALESNRRAPAERAVHGVRGHVGRLADGISAYLGPR